MPRALATRLGSVSAMVRRRMGVISPLVDVAGGNLYSDVVRMRVVVGGEAAGG